MSLFHNLSISEIVGKIKSGDISAKALAEEVIKKNKRLSRKIQALAIFR